jgi:hypothetical protein
MLEEKTIKKKLFPRFPTITMIAVNKPQEFYDFFSPPFQREQTGRSYKNKSLLPHLLPPRPIIPQKK